MGLFVQHFRSATLDAWRFRVFSRLSERKGFLGGHFADFRGSVHFVVKGMVMVTCFGSVLSHPFSMFGMFLNLFILCLLIEAAGLDVCFGMVGLSGICPRDPWAASIGALASFRLERCLGAYPVDFTSCWSPPEYWDAADIALASIDGFEVAGAGVYLLASEVAFEGAVW